VIKEVGKCRVFDPYPPFSLDDPAWHIPHPFHPPPLILHAVTPPLVVNGPGLDTVTVL